VQRIQFLASAAATAALNASTIREASAQAALTTIRIGSTASEATGQVFYAADQGFFRSHGLEAQITALTSGPAGAAAMVAGDLDVVEVDTVTLAKAYDHDQPFVFIAAGLLHTPKSPTLGIILRDASAPSNYNGKTFAVNALQNIAVVLGDAWIDRNGGDSKTLKWVEMPFPAMTVALQRGIIDGYPAPEPFLSQAVKSGLYVDYLVKNPLAPAIMQGGWIATRDWVAKNAVMARAFVAAMRDAGNWANHNRKESGDILVKYSKMAPDVIAGMGRGDYEDRLDPATIQPLIDATAHYGIISKTFPARNIIVTL
jgi:NitT/TauT family transport system substrate-binding protein